MPEQLTQGNPGGARTGLEARRDACRSRRRTVRRKPTGELVELPRGADGVPTFIRQASRSLGMTGAELADAIGSSPTAVAGWRCSHKTPSAGPLLRLVYLLHGAGVLRGMPAEPGASPSLEAPSASERGAELGAKP